MIEVKDGLIPLFFEYMDIFSKTYANMSYLDIDNVVQKISFCKNK